jgi:hypothetical protein
LNFSTSSGSSCEARDVDQHFVSPIPAIPMARSFGVSGLPQCREEKGIHAGGSDNSPMVDHRVKLMVDSLGTWIGSRRIHLGARRSAALSPSASRSGRAPSLRHMSGSSAPAIQVSSDSFPSPSRASLLCSAGIVGTTRLTLAALGPLSGHQSGPGTKRGRSYTYRCCDRAQSALSVNRTEQRKSCVRLTEHHLRHCQGQL